MSWFSGLFEGDYKKTFSQELELLIARWTDVSKKGADALPIETIGDKLLTKAEQLLDDDLHRRKRKP